MSKGKALTFEEVWISSDGEPGELKDYALHVFELSRLGMIPAENAIVVPDEWPEWAECAVLAWCKDSDYRRPTRTEFAGVWVSRPVPAFVPGWYWTKDNDSGVREPLYLRFSDPAYTIGPKIEEPEE